jgi:hypothetical protein
MQSASHAGGTAGWTAFGSMLCAFELLLKIAGMTSNAIARLRMDINHSPVNSTAL